MVSTHKPGAFPTRVFYTRKWIDPQGKTFGKDALRVTTLGYFRTLTKGYRYRHMDMRKASVEEAAEALSKHLNCTTAELLARLGTPDTRKDA